MIKTLTLQGVRADLGQARHMLASARDARDIVAELQFSQRVDALQAELASLQDIAEHVATATIFFGGRPVVGSRGIDAAFASKAIDSFQRLLSRQFAQMEVGESGPRAPTRAHDEARMMVTDIARGSVGFVLEESPEQGQLVPTELSRALEVVGDALAKFASPSDEWIDALESLDERVVNELKAFFGILDEAGASVRIVQGASDSEVSQEAVHRARSRVDLTQVTEGESPWLSGQIIGYTSRAFEFLTDAGDKLVGKIAREPARKIDEAGRNRAIQQFMYTPIRARFSVRTVQSGTWTRRYYTLADIDDR